MYAATAVILIPNDTARTGSGHPMLLARVLGAPLLRWLSHALYDRGVRRFFLICRPEHLNEALHCIPAGCTSGACTDAAVADSLHTFLTREEEEGEVLVITGACVCLPPEDELPDAPMRAYRVDQAELLSALDGDSISFGRFVLSQGTAVREPDGLHAVTDPAALRALAGRLRRAQLRSLAANGVELWDEDSCTVDPGVTIGAGTVLLPGSILRGATCIGTDCVIGPNTLLENARIGSGCHINASQLCDCTLGNDCAVGPFAAVRSGAVLDGRVRVGSGSELSAVHIGEGTHIGALCALRELESGRSCTIGAGCISATTAPEAAGRVVLEDDAVIGGGTTLAGALHIGRSAGVSAGATLRADVPPQALTTVRARSATRKDWALHKK